MKKKGLIISTVVMVIVLIASLTTATYAWFSSTSQAVVGDIGMSATAAEGLVIGAANKANPATRMDYDNGAVKWNGTGWINDSNTHGLGAVVTPQMDQEAEGGGGTESVALAFKLSKAATKKTAAHTADAVKDLTNGTFIKAEGNDTVVNATTWEKATVNEDYLDLTLGVAPSSDKQVSQVICTLTVTATDKANVEMAAAIHFDIIVTAPDGAETTVATDLDAYTGLETTTTGFSKAKEGDVTQGTYSYDNGTWTYKFVVADKAAGLEANATTLDIAKVKVVAWIEGTDASCTVANTGLDSGATIGLAFDYVKTTEYATGKVTITNGKVTA